MSFRVVGKVLRDSEETLARRLILIVLAEAAHDDGVAWLDQQSIARKARLSRTHVTERLLEMEADGVLELRKAQLGRRRINVYRIMLPGLDDVDYDRIPRVLSPFTASESPTPPDVTTSDLRRDDVGSTLVTTSDPRRNRGSSPLVEPELGEPSRNLPAKVDGKALSREEGSLAVAVLEEWNHQTGQKLTSRDWYLKIVMRLREYPDLRVEDHAHVIAVALANPWWKGPPNPSVVYGSGAQFERSILAVTSPPPAQDDRRRAGPGGGPTPEEMIRRAYELAKDQR